MKIQTIKPPFECFDDSLKLSPGSLLPSNKNSGKKSNITPEKYSKAFQKTTYSQNEQNNTTIRKPLVDIFNLMGFPETPKVQKTKKSKILQNFNHKSSVIERIRNERPSVDYVNGNMLFNSFSNIQNFPSIKNFIPTRSYDFKNLNSQNSDSTFHLFDFRKFIPFIKDYEKDVSGFKKIFSKSGNLVYKGEMKDGFPHGKGKMYNTKLAIEIRVNFRDFKTCSCAWSHLTSDFERGYPQGYTTIYFSGPQKFMGICKIGNIDGEGSFSNENEFYMGIWEKNILIKQF